MITRWRWAVMAAVVSVSHIGAVPVRAQDQSIRDISEMSVDRAQLRSAVASRTLTWLTGTPADNEYLSVGRMANFFGFVALRVSSGQSLTRAHVARDTLAVLQPEQVAGLVDLLEVQRKMLAAAQAARLEMNGALEGLVVEERLSEPVFVELGRQFGAAEAALGRVIAVEFGAVARSLSAEQRVDLTRIRAAHAGGTPPERADRNPLASVAEGDRQALVNLSARFLSWTTGTPELNDFEVVGKPSQHFGFVSLRLASGHAVRRGEVSRDVLSVLTPRQRGILEEAVDQNIALFEEFLTRRGALMRELERALVGDDVRADLVLRLGADVGEVEARMTWAQAQAMLRVRSSLSAAQREELLALRGRYTAESPVSGGADAVSRGRQLFAACAMCHASGSSFAPPLTAIVGREIASAQQYEGYSPALEAFRDTELRWSTALLDVFLEAPRDLVPGTTMGYDGMPDASDRAALLAYLETLE
ncbi:MAG: c-type cytochrome [Pseudomonadota bacterium]